MTAAAREPLDRRTFSPVRRDSRPKGMEGSFWRPVHRTGKWKILDAAKRLDWRSKAKGRRNGALGYVGLKVLEELLRLVDHASGRLDPSLLTLAARTRLSKHAVVSALARLQAAGFVARLRRFVETGLKGVRGPQVAQTTNAYRLELPPAAAALLPKPPPPPDDFETARAARAAEIRAMATADLDDRVAALHRDRRGRNASPPTGLNPRLEES